MLCSVSSAAGDLSFGASQAALCLFYQKKLLIKCILLQLQPLQEACGCFQLFLQREDGPVLPLDLIHLHDVYTALPTEAGLGFSTNHIYTAKNITVLIAQDCKKHYSKTWQFINVYFLYMVKNWNRSNGKMYVILQQNTVRCSFCKWKERVIL